MKTPGNIRFRRPLRDRPSENAPDGRKPTWQLRRGYAPWLIAAFAGALVPVLLYQLYVVFPASRPWIDLGQVGPIELEYGEEGGVKPPLFGIPLAGGYLFLLLSTFAAYLLAGAGLSVRRGPPAESDERGVPLHLSPAISALFLAVPLLAAAWILNAKAARFPDFPWEFYGEKEGPAETLIAFRRALEIALFFPMLAAGLSTMSFVIAPTRTAVILCAVSLSAFVVMTCWLNLLGG